jgi:uncharacterized protein YndB with AHSA1/START domain
MKKIEKQIEIAATPDEVWRALTEAEEIKRWFTLDARVKPGQGGSMWLSFGENMAWESPITVWKPGKQVQTSDMTPAGPVAVDYTIESRGGTTIVRLVHSGFADDTWEDELDNLNSGWAAFLALLKHYLERHRGEPRAVAVFRHPKIEIPRAEAFRRTVARLGIQENLSVGDRYRAAIDGQPIEGSVRVFAPPVNFSATIENWNESFLLVEMEPGRKSCRPAIWVSLYGDERRRAAAVEAQVTALLQKEFA